MCKRMLQRAVVKRCQKQGEACINLSFCAPFTLVQNRYLKCTLTLQKNKKPQSDAKQTLITLKAFIILRTCCVFYRQLENIFTFFFRLRKTRTISLLPPLNTVKLGYNQLGYSELGYNERNFFLLV